MFYFSFIKDKDLFSSLICMYKNVLRLISLKGSSSTFQGFINVEFIKIPFRKSRLDFSWWFAKVISINLFDTAYLLSIIHEEFSLHTRYGLNEKHWIFKNWDQLLSLDSFKRCICRYLIIRISIRTIAVPMCACNAL